ncbi:hypothetical protein [Alteromonas sp. KUL49]|uniref:hypothetical protein n=1 Tax=Alteromonas sp. KUL49 TaxID=2480798 RepID=UPI00102EEE89|nr:hypothetical protein [Alteromonas sp. KUL49]TAP34130.1 hypothetical protein EYS00_19630 [Alteromonas sp. KUL49]GEA13611.1 hypothetical protein KUL49_39860 [Alteromonas sp. KUL49]
MSLDTESTYTLFRVQIEEAGDYELFVKSTSFDPVVLLNNFRNNTFQQLYANDDIDVSNSSVMTEHDLASTDSYISAYLESGTFIVAIRPLGSAGSARAQLKLIRKVPDGTSAEN